MSAKADKTAAPVYAEGLPRPVAQVVEAFSQVPGTCAIALCGSRAIGNAVAASDFDLMVFAPDVASMDEAALKGALARLGSRPKKVSANSVVSVKAGDHDVELFFRTIDSFAAEVELARKGEYRRAFNPLHLMGFISTVKLGYLAYSRSLWDPEGRLTQLAQSAAPYPEALGRRMISDFRTEAGLALIHAGKVRSVQEIAYLSGLYARVAGAWSLILFAANRRYPNIDKGARKLLAALPSVPQNYDFRCKAIFRAAAAGDLKGALGEATRLHAEVKAIAEAAASAE